MPGSTKRDGPNQPELSELIPISKAAKLSGLAPVTLRLLVREGTVWGTKIGRNWVTTESAVREYMARDRRPGRKPKS